MTSRSNTEMQVKVAGYQPSPSKCLLKNSFRASLLLSGFACAVLPTDVFANEDNDTWTLAPISVTAEKRTENVMDVSSSVSVIDGQKIEDCILFASIALHALRGDGLSIQELVISLFLFITAPVSAYMVAKAALQRRTTFFDNTINTEMSKDILERRAPKD